MCVVCAWYLYGVYGVHGVHGMRGMCMARAWYVYGTWGGEVGEARSPERLWIMVTEPLPASLRSGGTDPVAAAPHRSAGGPAPQRRHPPLVSSSGDRGAAFDLN